MTRSTDRGQEGDGYLPLKALAAYSGLSVRTLRSYLGIRRGHCRTTESAATRATYGCTARSQTAVSGPSRR
jgi:hypothetical protein